MFYTERAENGPDRTTSGLKGPMLGVFQDQKYIFFGRIKVADQGGYRPPPLRTKLLNCGLVIVELGFEEKFNKLIFDKKFLVI